MPQKITLYLVTVFLICYHSVNYAQTNSNYNCYKVAKANLLNTSFATFEKDVFTHYNADQPMESYKTFLNEVANLTLDLKKLPSSASIDAARAFKKNAVDKNALWVLLSTYDDVANKDKAILPQETGAGAQIFTFNYRGGFIQCLKNNSTSQGFKDIVNTLEADGNVSPSIIAQLLLTLPDAEFDTDEVKNFIAFDIYYSILLIVEKAFP